MEELITREKDLTKDTFETMVCIRLSSGDNIVINLNTAFSALSYSISYDITQMTEFCQIDEFVEKYNELVNKLNDDSTIHMRYDDEIAFSIICGLKLKLEKELYVY